MEYFFSPSALSWPLILPLTNTAFCSISSRLLQGTIFPSEWRSDLAVKAWDARSSCAPNCTVRDPAKPARPRFPRTHFPVGSRPFPVRWSPWQPTSATGPDRMSWRYTELKTSWISSPSERPSWSVSHEKRTC